MKVGDLVKLQNEEGWHKVYGEVYKPIYHDCFYPGVNSLSAIEIYVDGIVKEFTCDKIIKHKKLVEK